MGLLDAVESVVDGATDAATLGGNGPFVAYVERLSDGQRWLVSAVVGAGSSFPSLDFSFIDLSGNGQADLSVQVGVSLDVSLSNPTIASAQVRVHRQTTTQTLPPFRLVIRADGSSVKPADDSSTADIPFIYLEFDGTGNTVAIPEELEITATPDGLNTTDPSTWVPRECATDAWPRDASEPDGQQFDVSIDVANGPVPTEFEAGLISDGRVYNPSGSDLKIASATETPYVASNAGPGDATIAETKSAASELQAFDVSVREASTSGGATDVTLNACLWRELVANASPGLLDTQVALSMENSETVDIDVDVTSRDSSGTSTVDVRLDEVPTEIAARLLPSRRAVNPGATGSDGQDAWVGYRANGTLGELRIDAAPAGADPLWLYASGVPKRVGFTQAGAIDEAFVARGGDPNNLDDPMPSGIDRVAVELGPDRAGVPGSDVDVRETVSGGDTTLRLAVPGLDHFDVEIDPPPTADAGLLDRRVSAFYHRQATPDPLDATIDVQGITGQAVDLPHEMTAVLEPAKRSPNAAADEPWLEYRADQSLERLELDVEDTLWLWLEGLPKRVGFTQAGDLSTEAFVVDAGDPDDLENPLPSAIDRVALELGPNRDDPPSDELEVHQTVTGGATTWRLAVPGLTHVGVDIDAPPSQDAGLLDRTIEANVSLGGAEQPLDGTLRVDDVSGFEGSGTIQDFPTTVRLTHVPDGDGGHDLDLTFGEERLGGVDVSASRSPQASIEEFPYRRIDARIRWLPALGATWTQSPADGSLQHAKLGHHTDVTSVIDGGLGQVTLALDQDADADPVLAPAPKLRFEQVARSDDSRLLVGAAALGRARFDALDDGVEVEVVRAPHPYSMNRMATHMQERSSEYSLAVVRESDADGTPARTVVHGGNLRNRLQATLTTGEEGLEIETEGVLERLKALHMVKPTGEPGWDADGLRANVSIPRLPESMGVAVGDTTTLELPAAMRARVGLRNPEGIGAAAERHVDARIAVSEGSTTLDTAGDGISVDAGDGHGITGRVALSRALDDLTAIRATPQAFDHSDTEPDGSSTRVSTTARVYGLRRFDVSSSTITRNKPGLLETASNLDLGVELDPDRPNPSFRIETFGADTPNRDPRWQARARLADIADDITLRMRAGEKPWQTRIDAAARGGPLAEEGDLWAEPAQVPWDGPAAGELVGVGLLEAALESLPVEVTFVTLPFAADPGNADPSDRSGYMSGPGGSFHPGGQLIEVTGSLEIRDMLQLGWARSGGGKDKWARSDIACLRVEADEGGQFWLRQLADRGVDIADSKTKLNIMVDSSARVTMRAENYSDLTSRGGDPTHWSAFNGSWTPAAKLLLKNFAGWTQVDPGLFPVTDDVKSGNWWVRSVGGFPIAGDASLGSTSGTTFDKNPIDDVCGGD